MEPPEEIDGARVLWWAWSDAGFGDCGDQAVHGFAVCRYETGQLYRFSCDLNWETVNDMDHDSEAEALADIPLNYDASKVKWVRRSS